MIRTNIKSLYLGLLCITIASVTVSCDEWLDKLPDNRMELKTPSDITSLLVSAYPETHPAYLLEMYSDNTDDCLNSTWTEADRFQRQAYNWNDITETFDEETPQELWNTHYKAIAAANAAIETIDEMDNSDELSPQLGEALLCRAFAMFQLSTVFCNAYDPTTASSELGLPYPIHTESKVGETHSRGTLKDLYDQRDTDIQRALPLVGSNYSKPKFHFTPDAAKAFASRFYLYKGDFDKCISYATAVLGDNPEAKARNWDYFNSLNNNSQIRPEAYVSSDEKCNLLLLSVYTQWGAICGPYMLGEKYAHSYRIAWDEDIESTGVWGVSGEAFKTLVFTNPATANLLHRKIPYEAEFSDVQSGVGFPHTEFAVFTTELTLLERAEAYALKGDLQNAVNDFNTMLKIWMRTPRTFTLQQIANYYNGIAYYTPTEATVKKKFDKPVYEIDTDGSDQEALLQGIMHLRRIFTVHEGFRMQDVKRYGIVIYRRQTNVNNVITAVTDTMEANDPRRAIQLPQDVISSGLEPNKR